jgi:hypothetical protein
VIKLSEDDKEAVLASVRSALNTENRVQTQVGFDGKTVRKFK